MEYFNLYREDDNGLGFGIYGLTKYEVLTIAKAIHEGTYKIQINGKVYFTSGRNFQFYTVEERFGKKQDIQDYFKKFERYDFGKNIESTLSESGKNVTEEIFKEASGQDEPIVKGLDENGVISLFELLHPIIVKVSKKLYCETNYKEAVHAAITEVNEYVRKIYIQEKGSEKTGY